MPAIWHHLIYARREKKEKPPDYSGRFVEFSNSTTWWLVAYRLILLPLSIFHRAAF
jgi:hypothetical protein